MHKKGRKYGPPPQGGGPAQSRPLQGMDQKQFVLNDVVPIVLSDPTNDTTYTVIVSADVNGYTYEIQTQQGAAAQFVTSPYGETTGQFSTQAMFYTQYYTKTVHCDLTLTSGGGVYSLSPIVSLINPAGVEPFSSIGSSAFLAGLSSPQNTTIHQPYTKNQMHIDYSKWLVSMSDRAWRQTIQIGASTGRELYPTDSGAIAQVNENFKLPSQTRVFQITIPQGKFNAGAGPFVIGILKFKTTYMFSQRRTDINDLLGRQTETVRQEERQKAQQAIANMARKIALQDQMLNAGQELDLKPLEAFGMSPKEQYIQDKESHQ